MRCWRWPASATSRRCSRANSHNPAAGRAAAAAATPSKGIVDPGKYREALAAVADIHVADDERRGEAAQAQAPDAVQVGQRAGARPGKHPADIDEGGELEVDLRRGDIQRADRATELGREGKRIAPGEASKTIAAQRLRTAEEGTISTDAAERPEGQATTVG